MMNYYLLIKYPYNKAVTLCNTIQLINVVQYNEHCLLKCLLIFIIVRINVMKKNKSNCSLLAQVHLIISTETTIDFNNGLLNDEINIKINKFLKVLLVHVSYLSYGTLLYSATSKA